MNEKMFYDIFMDAQFDVCRDQFVSDWALSTAWGEPEDAEIPTDRIEQIGAIWDIAHTTIRDIRAKTGLSQAAFSRRFCIPRRTVESWESEERHCPPYVRLLLAKAVCLA